MKKPGDQGARALGRDRFTAGAVIGVAVLAIAWSVWLKAVPAAHDPFWLDEAWTGAIVGQASWGGFWRQMYWDVNAPLYYLLMHLWQGVFGLSDLSLRTPSLLAAIATPLVPALIPLEGLRAPDRLTWAALLALWFPAVSYAQEARAYALLLLLCTAQAAAFIALLRKPGVGRAAIWALISTLAILTHYEALVVSGLQGLTYLAAHRMRAVRTWPAALIFVPAFGWIAYHWPTIQTFARPDTAWYPKLKAADLPVLLSFLADSPELRDGIGLLAVYGLLQRAFSWGAGKGGGRGTTGHLWLAVGPAIAGAMLVIALGFVRPSFTLRYLTPFAPGVALALVLAFNGLARDRVAATQILLIGMTALASSWMLLHHQRQAPKLYNFEQASRWIEAQGAKRLVFLWDNPADRIMRPAQLQALGGFFLRRDGDTVAVQPVSLRPGEDPNPVLTSAAAPSGSALIWMYDLSVPGTAARLHPPRLPPPGPGWRCRDFAPGHFGVWACLHAQGGPA